MAAGEEYPPRGTPIGELADAVSGLSVGDALTIAEFSPDGIVVWEVSRDRTGTPYCRYWPAVPWPADGSDLTDREFDEIVQRGPGSRLILGCGPSPLGQHAQDFDRFCFSRGVPHLKSSAPLAGVLRHVIVNDPLVQWYELVVLERDPSGAPRLKGCRLFPPGAQRGDRKVFTVRCEPTDENGTVFAVVATEQVRQFRLLSLASAALPPGSYRVTAELSRPGVVRFRGLPAELRPDRRPWADLVATVPGRLDVPRPSHLICAVETSGAQDQVFERLHRVEQLVQYLEEGAEGQLVVSLVSYGPHSFEPRVPEDRVRVHAWAGPNELVLTELDRLRARGATPRGYPHAAQLECALTEIAERLTGKEGRPVVVSVGARTACPPRSGRNTNVLPCRHRRDWQQAMRLLRKYPGVTFGAIYGPSPVPDGPVPEIWQELGRGDFAWLDSFDVQSFAAELGLRSMASARIPFPLIESEEG